MSQILSIQWIPIEDIDQPPKDKNTHEFISFLGQSYLNLEKIGRNEKVNVKYRDGKILNDVKYKKVINDVMNGDCEIMES